MFAPIVVFCIILLPSIGAVDGENQLRIGFYESSCPHAEDIIFNVVKKNENTNKGTAPGIMRLLFHDCFITGCDASILVKPTSTHQTEMSHPANGDSLRGLEVIDEAKAEVEKQCPGTVSCADILAFAARDSATLLGNPKYSVPAGRRDSLSSNMGDADALPASKWSVNMMTEAFQNKGISQEHLVALLGAHSTGISRCFNTIANQDYLSRVPGAKSILYGLFRQVLKQKYCRDIMKGTAAFNLDHDLTLAFPNMSIQIRKESSSDFGCSFYKHIMRGRGLLPSDLGLVADPKTREFVKRFAYNSTLWAEKFSEAMVQLGNLNVLTGNQGEIRKVCGSVNSH